MAVLTDLSWFQEGVDFPPQPEVKRLMGYKKNLSRYAGTYNDNYKLEIQTDEGSVPVPIKVFSTKWYKTISDKQVGLITNVKPVVAHMDKELSKILNDKIVDTNFWYKVILFAKSTINLGDGVLNIFPGDNETGDVTHVNPLNWFRVVDINNISETVCHVCTQVIYNNEVNNGVVVQTPTHLRIIEHYKGEYRERYHLFDGKRIGQPVKYKTSEGIVIPAGGKVFNTGLDDFAIVSAHNSLPIDGVYGISDFDAFAEYVTDLEKYLTVFKWVLDQNGRPYKVVSMELLKRDQRTDTQKLDPSRTLTKKPETVNPIDFVSPTINVDAYKTMFNELNKGISTGTEFGDVFLRAEFSTASGEALKTLLKGPLDKASRLIDAIEYPIKKALCLMMHYEGYTMSPSEISITWQDGITESSQVLADTARTRVESGTLSKQTAIQMLDGVSEEQALEELKLINQETGLAKLLAKLQEGDGNTDGQTETVLD